MRIDPTLKSSLRSAGNALCTIFLICLLLQQTSAKIQVVSPESLKGTQIDYTLSTFGIIDYQATTVVKVFTFDDELACYPPSDAMLQIKSTKPKAFLVRRGGCSYEEKARNAHRAGARVVIVYQDTDEKDADDKSPIRPDLKVRDELPPLIKINKSTGEKFISALVGNSDLQLEIDYFIGTFAIPVPVRLIYSPFDRNGLEIYQGLLQLNLPAVNQTTKHTIPLKKPLVLLNAVPKIGRAAEFEYGPNEISRYCVPHSDHCVMKSLVEHQPEYQEVYLGIALHCLHDSLTANEKLGVPNPGYIKTLIRYLTTLHNLLETAELQSNITKDFLEIVMKNKDPYTESAVSCIRQKAPVVLGENDSIQKDFIESLMSASFQTLNVLPAMYIQQKFVKGDIDRTRAVGAFCDVLKKSDLPPICFTIKDEADKTSSSILDYTPSVEKIGGTQAALVFLLLAGIVVIIFYFVSKYVFKSNMQTDISREIDDTLNKYYNVQSSRNQSGGFQSYKELTKNTP